MSAFSGPIFATKAVLFTAVFAISALLLWVNGALALRFARPRHSASSLTPLALSGIAADASWIARTRPLLPWRLLILAAALVIALLDRNGRDRQMGPDPAVHLPGAVRPERSAVRQGHRLLPVLAAGLRRAQELDAVDPAAEQRSWPARYTAARRHQSGQPHLALFARSHRPWLGAAGPLFRGEGLVLCAGPLPAALQRQRRRGRRRLYRCPYRAAGSLAADRPRRRRRRCRMGQCTAAHLSACHRRGGRWCSAARSCSANCFPGCSNASSSSRASCSWRRRIFSEHRADAGSLQSPADHGEAIPRGAGSDLPVAAGQPRHHRQHPAVGLAAADGHLRAAPGDPHLLPVPRC